MEFNKFEIKMRVTIKRDISFNSYYYIILSHLFFV
jgi:hypothetical protein